MNSAVRGRVVVWLFYSAIHKAASLTVPGHSMILPGTIPETRISREWSRQLEQPLGIGNITICPAMNINFWFLGGVSLLQMFTTTRPHGNVNRITWLGISQYF